jgi:hypothetical protein
MRMILKSLLCLSIAFVSQNVAQAAVQLDSYGEFDGFMITFYTGSESYQTGAKWSVFDYDFIIDYVDLGNLYGNNARDGMFSFNTIFTGWDDYPNTKLRALGSFVQAPAYNRPATISPMPLSDGRYASFFHVSTNWLAALNSDPSLASKYQFEFLTYDQVNALTIPEPSVSVLLFGTASFLLLKRRSRR